MEVQTCTATDRVLRGSSCSFCSSLLPFHVLNYKFNIIFHPIFYLPKRSVMHLSITEHVLMLNPDVFSQGSWSEAPFSSHVLLILSAAAGVMALLPVLLSVLLLSVQASPSCPASCRCYSLTVECGSTSLRDVPKHIPASTQVPTLSSLHQY